jgi:transposase
MGDSGTAVAEEAAAQAVSGAQAARRSQGFNRHFVHSQIRHAVGDVAEGDGLRLGDELLAQTPRLAGRRCLGSSASGTAQEVARSGPDRFLACGGRQRFGARRTRGKKTGPNPTDRRKAGSKHHILSDAQGVPLSVILTEANRHDVTQLLPLIDAIPPIAGQRGRPLRRPRIAQGDRAYDSQPHRKVLRARGIKPLLARRYTEHGSGLGVTRWVIERTIAWLHQFRRLRVRYERLPEIHEAFLKLGCAMICWRTLGAV